MTSRALIVDSGMKNVGGHNFSYTRSVQRALASRGIASDVFTNRAIAPDLASVNGFLPVFTYGAYDFAPGLGWLRDLRYIYAQSATFAAELERALKTDGREYDLIFSHTLADFELIGWSRFLQRNEFRGRLVLLLRNTPGFRRANRLKVRAHPYWRIKPHSLNSIYRQLGDRFLLVTDSEALTEDYSAIYDHPIGTLPIPLHDSILRGQSADSSDFVSRYDLARSGSIRAGYLGDARPSKGFLLLPQLVRDVLSRTSNVRFIIQCPPWASASDDTLPGGVAELRAIEASAGGRLTLIPERLSENDYAALLRHLDVVLIPYRREGYIEPTSGIFAEALALAKPVVVPRDTWMSRELKKSGAGVEFTSDDAGDLAAKVIEVSANYGDFQRKAAAFSEQWRRFHNAETLVSMLEESAA